MVPALVRGSFTTLGRRAFPATLRGGRPWDDMHLHASGYCGELFLKADKKNNRAIVLEPCGSTSRSPSVLAGGLLGNCEGDCEQILDATTHGGQIADNKKTATGEAELRAWTALSCDAERRVSDGKVAAAKQTKKKPRHERGFSVAGDSTHGSPSDEPV